MCWSPAVHLFSIPRPGIRVSELAGDFLSLSDKDESYINGFGIFLRDTLEFAVNLLIIVDLDAREQALDDLMGI